MPWSREEIFLKKYINFTFLPQNYLPLKWGGGRLIYKFLSPYPTEFGLDWPSSSWGEDVNRRRTTDDDGRQPIAMGHLSYSGDLKTFFYTSTLKWTEKKHNKEK